MTTARGTDTHRLASFELPVGQGPAVAESGLLDVPLLSPAHRTNTRFLVGRQAGVGGTKNLLAAPVTDRVDHRPEFGNRLEG